MEYPAPPEPGPEAPREPMVAVSDISFEICTVFVSEVDGPSAYGPRVKENSRDGPFLALAADICDEDQCVLPIKILRALILPAARDRGCFRFEHRAVSTNWQHFVPNGPAQALTGAVRPGLYRTSAQT
jgi:hypothetical protein